MIYKIITFLTLDEVLVSAILYIDDTEIVLIKPAYEPILMDQLIERTTEIDPFMGELILENAHLLKTCHEYLSLLE